MTLRDWAVTPIGSRRMEKFQEVKKAVEFSILLAEQGVKNVLTHQGAGRTIAEVWKQDGIIRYIPGTGYWHSRIDKAVEVLNARGAVDATQPEP